MGFRQIVLLIVSTAWLASCTNHHSRSRDELPFDGADTTGFPKVIDGGKRVVYQFSKMTPRGVRYFLDTVDYRENVSLPFLNANIIFPLSVREEEREKAKGLIAISLPGYFDETIIGIIDDDRGLKLKLKNTDVVLSSLQTINFGSDTCSATFRKDSVRVSLVSEMKITPTETHRAGRGTLQVYEQDSLVQSCEIFLVVKR